MERTERQRRKLLSRTSIHELKLLIIVDGEMPFCVKCGYEIPVGAAFCPSCGAPATPMPTPPLAPPYTAAPPAIPITATYPIESVLYAIDGQVGASRHLLAFTDRRLIVALVGGGATRIITGGLLRMAYESSKIQHMKGEVIEELLADKKTYVIPYNEIYSIEAKKGRTLGWGSITINKTSGEQIKFNVDINRKIDEVERCLKPILGQRLVIAR
jgi:hypothetical protein